jgi:hypothetical protein
VLGRRKTDKNTQQKGMSSMKVWKRKRKEVGKGEGRREKGEGRREKNIVPFELPDPGLLDIRPPPVELPKTPPLVAPPKDGKEPAPPVPPVPPVPRGKVEDGVELLPVGDKVGDGGLEEELVGDAVDDLGDVREGDAMEEDEEKEANVPCF